MRIAPLFIALPILLSFGHLPDQMSAVQAAGLQPAEATALLAKSQVIDKRCNILAEVDRQELQDLVARAEIALAEMHSVAAAKSALAKGRSGGKTAICGADMTNMVQDVLTQARSGAKASSEAPTPVEKPQATIVEPIVAKVTPMPKQLNNNVASAFTSEKPPKFKDIKKSKDFAGATPTNQKSVKVGRQPVKLSQYASIAEQYFVDRRCHSKSLSAMKQLYANVLTSHRDAMANNRHADVKAMLHNVEVKANSQSCG